VQIEVIFGPQGDSLAYAAEIGVLTEIKLMKPVILGSIRQKDVLSSVLRADACSNVSIPR
jgi:hypothetical protein